MMIESHHPDLTRNELKNPTKAGHKRRRLLILAHEQTRVLQTVHFAFQSRGWIVDMAAPTVEILGLAKRRPYDLVILRIVKPGAEGFAWCEAFRQRSHVPLLLIVSPAVRKEIVYAFDKGADAYVVEPFDLRELLVRAEALIRRSEGHF